MAGNPVGLGPGVNVTVGTAVVGTGVSPGASVAVAVDVSTVGTMAKVKVG